MKMTCITCLLHAYYNSTFRECILHENYMHYMSITCLTCLTSTFAMDFDTVFFCFVLIHSQPDQCSWEYPLKTVHLDGCSLPSCFWTRFQVGWARWQFYRSEEHWNNDGMQWLPVWGMEWADSQNTYWDVARQIRGGDSHCSNWSYLGQARRGQNVGRPWGLSPLLLSSIKLSDTIKNFSC